jgi:glycosyltransferase involved in cell wall biosynthesis
MRLLLATDAWEPQVNGVVRTLTTVVNEVLGMGHAVEVVAVGDYPSFPLPTYPEIRLTTGLKGLRERIADFDPDCIHIATEGPIGLAVRRYCRKRGHCFTTSFHTRFPEYVSGRYPIPSGWVYSLIRAFHRPAFRTLVPTPTLMEDLSQRGFRHLHLWGRGVDTELFTPERRQAEGWNRPVMLNVGRIAPEKNLEAFLALDLPGSKVVVGDGPLLEEYRARYRDAHFPGVKHGAELARYFASADVFVFPSLTDTFGLVMLESIACGTPVAAFPVTGPLDVLESGVTGIMDNDLGEAVTQALTLDRAACREAAGNRAWSRIARDLLLALVPLNSEKLHSVREAQWANPATPA